MDTITLIEYAIVILIVALMGVGLGFIVKKGLQEKAQGYLTKGKILLNNYGPILEKKNPELYASLVATVNAMNEALKDNEVTMEEFGQIAKKAWPLIKYISGYVVKIIQGQATIDDILSEATDTVEEIVKS